MKKILVIDDDPAIQRILRRTFVTNGFGVAVAADGTLAMDALRNTRPHVIILDLYLPGKSGWELCREIKQELSSVSIIVLSAACDVVDKVLLLELGADDYVTKPFSPRELLARVRVAVRRSHSSNNEDVFKFDDIEVNFSAMEVRRGEKSVPLTPQEFNMLRFLVANEGRVVARSKLLDEVWGYTSDSITRTVDTHLLHLRQKLEHNPNNPVHFRTVHGCGYKFVR